MAVSFQFNLLGIVLFWLVQPEISPGIFNFNRVVL